ncbi:MAG: SpoVR family protein [Deltaproteobacteria bacterium]|nr:SpoVR family protein [Deltaproteobacteria bacterium]
MNLPPHLVEIQREIRGHVAEFGLDPFEVIFELVTQDEMNMVAAYGGFPTRYPHWKWGMEFDSLAKGHTYGLQRIYELVINTDPSYAYLMDSNSVLEQKLVMAHVYGHADFFKNNVFFNHTNRRMLDQMANHAARMRRYIDRHGVDKVEGYVDACLSIENLIDPDSVFFAEKKTPPKTIPVDQAPERPTVRLIPTEKSYLRGYINPEAFVEAERKKLEEERNRKKRFPTEPARDVLLFLMEHAPLEPWQRDVLDIVRTEAYYFVPQAQTKIMNEGWASYWHSRIMTTRALRDSELIDYAHSHSGTMGTRPGRINPYKLGIELFRDIEERWDKGQFGKDWEECDDLAAKNRWDKQLGLGRKKVFEVRRLYNDVTFIDEFLTSDFARKQELFVYGVNKKSGDWEIQNREFKEIKKKLVSSLANQGNPRIVVLDANFENRGELVLKHRHDGVDLQPDWAKETLANLHKVWTRPVLVATKVEGKGVVMRFDGQTHSEKPSNLINET